MKTNKFFAALLIGLATVACTPKASEATGEEGEAANEEVKEMTAKDYVPSKAVVDSVSYLVGVNFGSFIKGYNFGDLNYKQIVAGIKDYVNAKGNQRDPEFGEQFKINPEKLNDMFNSFLENRHNFILLTNKEKEQKFLAENKKNEGVVETPSGLQYRIIDAGNDVLAGPKDTVWVKYQGKLLDGTVFDETKEDADPVRMTLNRVIKGWTEGLQLVGEGAKIDLYVPAALAYGERGNQGIEPNSTLIFNVEVTKVGKVVEEAE